MDPNVEGVADIQHAQHLNVSGVRSVDPRRAVWLGCLQERPLVAWLVGTRSPLGYDLQRILSGASGRDLLQCVLADLSNRLSYAGGPFCTVTTASYLSLYWATVK